MSPAYAKNLLKQALRRLVRRNEWVALKTRDKAFTFDGIFSGPECEFAGDLGEREIPKLDLDWETCYDDDLHRLELKRSKRNKKRLEITAAQAAEQGVRA